MTAIHYVKSLGADPNDLMAVIAFESGRTFSPSVKNKLSGATGLIQFMPNTAKSLGTTTTKLSKMTALQQLDYVEKYFQPYKGRLTDIFDLYMAVLWPRAIGKTKSYILFSESSNKKAFKNNLGLDENDDGVITKSEATAKVIAHLNEGLRSTNIG